MRQFFRDTKMMMYVRLPKADIGKIAIVAVDDRTGSLSSIMAPESFINQNGRNHEADSRIPGYETAASDMEEPPAGA